MLGLAICTVSALMLLAVHWWLWRCLRWRVVLDRVRAELLARNE